MKSDTKVMQLKTKEQQILPKATQSQKEAQYRLPSSPQEEPTLPIPWFLAPQQ